MTDIQSAPDTRNIPIQRVGVKGLKHPLLVQDAHAPTGHDAFAVTGTLDLYVGLPADQKGAHMSRFLEILGCSPLRIGPGHLTGILDDMVTRLESQASHLQATFPFFMEKAAPVSGAKSLLDYSISLEASCVSSQVSAKLTVRVPITSLCPCSKAISEYGAHNQRSEVTVAVEYEPAQPISIESLIKIVEAQASCELYGLLKRPDEKAVTEKAYENPKFVEDLVRDIAAELQKLPNILGYVVSSENFESIHNHSAFAQVSSN